MKSLPLSKFGNTESTAKPAKGIAIPGIAPFPELLAVLASIMGGVGLFYALILIFHLLALLGIKI